MAIDEVTKFEPQDVQRYCVCMLSCTIETILRIASGLKSVESFDLSLDQVRRLLELIPVSTCGTSW